MCPIKCKSIRRQPVPIFGKDVGDQWTSPDHFPCEPWWQLWELPTHTHLSPSNQPSAPAKVHMNLLTLTPVLTVGKVLELEYVQHTVVTGITSCSYKVKVTVIIPLSNEVAGGI
jgi:hypothetical protein